nr:type I restriction-modification system subunit M N-terminal domain-containing protein [Siphonobacter sp. BAB-5385]
MLTGEKRSQIDRIWNTFWSGGISNPLTVIEQFTYLLFIKRLDDLQITKEFKASLLGEDITDPVYPESDYHLRWSRFKELESSEMLNLFTQKDGVFDFMRNYAGSDFQRFMKGATFLIPNARLLQQVVDLIDQVSMTDQDTKGDIYEYLLSKLSVAKQAGQFRTPRHIIKLIVELMAPTPKTSCAIPRRVPAASWSAPPNT